MREKEIVRLYKEGCKTERIAEILSLSQLTVETHKRNAMRRTGVDNACRTRDMG